MNIVYWSVQTFSFVGNGMEMEYNYNYVTFGPATDYNSLKVLMVTD